MKPLGSKIAWAAGAQGLQAMQSLMVTVIAARTGDVEEFGAFGVAFVLIVLVVGLTRSACGDALISTFTSRGEADYLAAASRTSGVALLLGVVLAAVTAVSALWLPSALAGTLGLVAIGLPVFALAECYRSILFGAGEVRGVVTNDATFVVVQCLLLLGVTKSIELRPDGVLIIWVIAGVVSCGLGAVQAKVVPRVGGMRQWFGEQGRLAGSFAIDFAAGQGALQFLTLLAAPTIGLKGMAAVRGAWTLTGPLTALIIAMGAVLLPEAVRRQEEGARLEIFMRRATFGLCGAVVAWGLLILTLPTVAGRLFLGDSFGGAREVAPGVFAFVLMNCVTMGPVWGLRVLQQGGVGAALRIVTGGLLLLFGYVGAELLGAPGVGDGAALAVLVVAPFWWGAFYRCLPLNRSGCGAG